jgi:hypothetical protein
VILGVLCARLLYNVFVTTGDIRNEYVGAVGMGTVGIIIVLLAMFELLKFGKVPKFTLGCMLLMDTFETVGDLWKFSTFSGVAQENWNPLAKSVLVYGALPLLIFWACLLAILVCMRRRMRTAVRV